MRQNTALANSILKRNLLGAVVESFGLSHQFLYIEFRDDTPKDHTLSIDTDLLPAPLDFDSTGLSDEEQVLILFSRINLQRVIEIQCNDAGTLAIDFENGRTLVFSGTPADKTCVEPWQIGKGNSAEGRHHYNVIANYGGGYSIWDGSNAPT